MKNIFLFSGQGTQYYHMGSDLRECHSGFDRNIMRLSKIVYDVTGCSILDVVYDPEKQKSDNFSDCRLSNIALLTIEYALSETLQQTGIIPAAVCGMSLGEYTAAVVAGAMEFETAVFLVANAGACFDTYCEPGAMLAVLDDINTYHNNDILCDSTDIAFDSHGKHFVIAGSVAGINTAEKYLRQKNICFQPLPVAFGYHSRNIDPARHAYTEILNNISFNTVQLPLYSTVTTRCINYLDGTHFWRTAREPIRLMEALDSIDHNGCYRYIDLGPTGTMANLMSYRQKEQSTSNIFSVVTPFNNSQMNYSRLINAVNQHLMPFSAAHV
ncbi:MAG: acyltransferase domain-containing protein [Gammaproteobacteria bacterium]|nr:acyltransferase domain-containing protein [Gammaproteobacteria bacterium]